MLKRMGIFMSLLWCLQSGFANTNDDIRAYQARGVMQKAMVSSEKLAMLQASSDATQSENRTMIDSFLKNARGAVPQKQSIKAPPEAILFVSFSMPESLLFALGSEAASFDIPVVIKGLVDRDFKKTIETFARLNREAKKQHFNFQGVSIDPLWFDQFQIESVPALVVSHRSSECTPQTLCPNQSFDVVYGNASLKKGLEIIRDKGDAAPDVAKSILERAHV